MDVRSLLRRSFEISERQLWITIGIVLGAAVLLLLVSFQLPWYASNYYPAGNIEVDSDYHFEEAHVRLYANGQLGQDRIFVYGENSEFHGLMSLTQSIIGFGTVMSLVFGGSLVGYYMGYVEQVKWIIGAWALGLGAIVFGIVQFSARVATTAVEEITRLANENDVFVSPANPIFWGEQHLASGRLVTNPGPGWLLAIFAVMNLVVVLVLLFHFPDESPDDDLADDFDIVDERGPREASGAPVAAKGD